jgi:hypothetical protein
LCDKRHIVLDIAQFPSIHCITTKGNTMKTVKIYMVRKPSDIDEVKELCQRYNNQAEEVTVAETVNLPPVWYDTVCRAPLDDYIFLSGKGGYDDENHRQVVALQCTGKPTLYVAPSGSSYCRYMGVEL